MIGSKSLSAFPCLLDVNSELIFSSVNKAFELHVISGSDHSDVIGATVCFS